MKREESKEQINKINDTTLLFSMDKKCSVYFPAIIPKKKTGEYKTISYKLNGNVTDFKKWANKHPTIHINPKKIMS